MKISKMLILSAAALSLAACGEHIHSFGDTWNSDDTSHWHECECGEKSDKADHVDENKDGKCDICAHDVEVPTPPTPVGEEVTAEEWLAAWGTDKTYYIADNYKLVMRLIISEGETSETFIVDGLKAKETATTPAGSEDYFYEKTSTGFDKYSKHNLSDWKKDETNINPATDFLRFLEPFGANYSKFTYDAADGTYKCEILTISGTDMKNMHIKFANKKVVSCGFDSKMQVGPETFADFTMATTFTYGGQTVTLPEVSPEPSGEEYKVTENQFNAAFTLEGLNNVTITTSAGSLSQTCEADGTKEFNVNMKPYDFYLNKENGVMYEYKQEDSKWVKNQREGTTFAREDMIMMFGNVYNQLSFDEDSNSYKGTNISIGGTVRYSEVEYCFENLKVVAIHTVGATGSAAGQSMTVTLTKYGQTVVTLPEIDPEPAQGMTEDEFNALVNIVNNVGLTILAKNTPMVEGVQIPEASSHTTYKYNVENEAYYLCTVDSDGSTSESKVVNQVSYYSHNGEPYQVRDLTLEQAHNSFIEVRAEAMAALLPSTDFSDYEYDSINDNYRLEISFEYDGIAVEEVLFYEMNADGITSVKGTSTATFEGRTMDSFVEIKNIVLGPQEITSPKNYIINNSMTWENAFGLKKGYYFFNTNYKATMKITTAASEENYVFTADLLNLKYELTTNNYGVEKYYSIEDNKYYEYSLDTVSSLWNKQRFDAGNLPVKILRDLIINPFKTNYSSFKYDEAIKSYKCQTLTYNNQEFNNVILHFEDSSLISASFDSFYDDAGKTPFSVTFSIVYGGQTVTLPQVD